MLEIDAAVVSKIASDATMISLMGITVSNNRVYDWYPQDRIIFSASNQSAIIYRNSLGSRNYNWSYPSEMPRLTYYFRILSINQLNLNQVNEKLIDLFDMTTIQTTNWSVKWIELSGSVDGPIEGDPTYPIYTKDVNFNFSTLVKRG